VRRLRAAASLVAQRAVLSFIIDARSGDVVEVSSLPFPFRLGRARSREEAERAAALVRVELPRVERLLGRMLGPRADLQDLVQTVFVEAVRSFAHYRQDGSPGAFIGGIAVKVARRALRGTAYSRRRSALTEVMAESLTSQGGNPEQACADQRALARLRIALDRIAAKKRIAFCLWALEGLEMPEIAALTGASVAATRSRIFHAQRELRRIAERDPVLRELVDADPPAHGQNEEGRS
jgi:RNA polymerase sigma-70 factor, ECF subfamily